MSRLIRQGQKHLLGPMLLLPNVVGRIRRFVGAPVLVRNPLDEPARRMPLLLCNVPADEASTGLLMSRGATLTDHGFALHGAGPAIRTLAVRFG